jgi:hypothetical protein
LPRSSKLARWILLARFTALGVPPRLVSLLVGVAPAGGTDASSNKAAVGASGARWWCLSATLLLDGRGSEEEREAVRWVLVPPLLAGHGGEKAGWCCASSAVALGRSSSSLVFWPRGANLLPPSSRSHGGMTSRAVAVTCFLGWRTSRRGFPPAAYRRRASSIPPEGSRCICSVSASSAPNAKWFFPDG